MQLISSMKVHFKPFLHLIQVQQASKQRKLNTFRSTLDTGVHITVTWERAHEVKLVQICLNDMLAAAGPLLYTCCLC